MEYCPLLWAGTPASHLSVLDCLESKALKINGISHDEAEAQGLLLSHHKQVSSFCFLQPIIWYCNLCSLSPLTLPVHSRSAGCKHSPNIPLLVGLPKSWPSSHINSFIPYFSNLWNHLPETVLSHTCLQDSSKLAAISRHPQF